MAAVGIGAALDIVGVAGYIATDMQSVTALIPTILGTLMIVCGFLGMKPQFLKHAMHAAAVVALLGIFGTARSPLALFSGEVETRVYFQVATLILCGLFMLVAVQSFIAARKRRKAAATEAPAAS
ncbi:MAG: hypothetical protein ACFB20_10090 [Opitutales bacterium]